MAKWLLIPQDARRISPTAGEPGHGTSSSLAILETNTGRTPQFVELAGSSPRPPRYEVIPRSRPSLLRDPRVRRDAISELSDVIPSEKAPQVK